MESATNTEASLILENGTHPQIYNSVMERTNKKKVILILAYCKILRGIQMNYYRHIWKNSATHKLCKVCKNQKCQFQILQETTQQIT